MTTAPATHTEPRAYRHTKPRLWIAVFGCAAFIALFGGILYADFPTPGIKSLISLAGILFFGYGLYVLALQRVPIRLYEDRLTYRPWPRATVVIPLEGATLFIAYDEAGRMHCAAGTEQVGIQFLASDPAMTPLYDILAKRLPIEVVASEQDTKPTFETAIGIYRRYARDRAGWSLAALVSAAGTVAATGANFVPNIYPSLAAGISLVAVGAIITACCLLLRRIRANRLIVSDDSIVKEQWPRPSITYPLDSDTTYFWRRTMLGPVLVLQNAHGRLTIPSRLDDFDRLAAAISGRFSESAPLRSRNDVIVIGPPWIVRLAIDFLACCLWAGAAYMVWSAITNPEAMRNAVPAIILLGIAAYLTFAIARRTRIDEHGIRVSYRLWSRTIPRERIRAVTVETRPSQFVTDTALTLHTTDGKDITLDATTLNRPAHALADTLRRLYNL